jgi:hypothetical protein
MNVAAALNNPSPVLRNAAGEPPLGTDGAFFRIDQGEMFENPDERYRPASARIGVLELEDGRWLAHPDGFRVDLPIFFASRDAALSHAVDEVVRRAETYMAAKPGEGMQWSVEYGKAVIAWAEKLRPAQAADRADGLANIDQPVTEADFANYERIDAGAVISDPVVAFLCEEYAKRKQFPAKHTIAMTNPIEDGRVMTVGTCSCGHVIKFIGGDYRRMDAAIEAHWRRFPVGDMVDGRGEPIKPGDGARIASAKKSRRKAAAPAAPAPDADDLPWNARIVLSAIARGEEAVDREAVRHLVGIGYVDCTETQTALTDEGRAFLESSDGSGLQQAAGTGDLPAAALQWDVTPDGQPSSEPAASSDGSEVRKDAGTAPGPSEAIEAAQICASSDEYLAGITARYEEGGGFLVAAAPLNAEETGALGVSDTPTSTAPGPVTEDQIAANVQGPSLDDDDLAIDWPDYGQFLEDKIVTAPMRGIEVARDDLHPWLKPHCKDLVVWALRLGCAAIFASFGLHKTAMQLEWCRQLVKRTGQPSLCVVPLGVRHGFIKEGLQLGMDVRFIRTTEELDDLYCEGVRHFLTNYESIREGKLDPNQFGACSLDEASVLRSYGSKTFQEFLPLFAKVPFKLVATATPSPNRYKELIHYSGFLGVMDTGLALTRFFQRNSEKAGDLTLYPHKEAEFWMWIHSWAAFLQKPSELGYSDKGYELPPLKLTWHEVPADHSKAQPERDGQGVMFRAVANSLQDAAKSRRDSLAPRIGRMVEIIAADPDSHRIIWHDLEAEREAIEQALPGVVTISGSMDIDAREVLLHEFEEGRTKHFATKPILSGSGSNFQYHCHKAVYVGMPGDGHKFNDFIQSLYRLQRFGQQHPVEVDIIYSEDMRGGRASLEQKWALDTEMRKRMSAIIRAHGLDTLPMREAMLRTLGVQRVEVKGERFVAINNDAVAECRAWPENSVDLMVSSIPFGTQYEYSGRYEDFGHSDDNSHFWSQMDFLSTELLRMLKPGRLACIHVKDRVLFGAVTGQGVPTVEPFHAEAIMHYRAHGFQYMGMITVVTDVVRENNQTYRLGWSENAKDGTKMGCGMPEYILLLRKPQSDRSRSYADVPVTKSKEDYTRARWQIDAHALWRSSGNRHLTREEFAAFSSADLAKLFAKTSAQRIYDFEAHVAIGEAVERTGTLPATFMAIAPGSQHPDVWSDINRMRTLNMMQQRKGAEMHLCPLQFDIVDRLIERYSNPDDLVFDPFGGLMTVPYRALLKGRRGAATELSATYFLDGVHYLHMAEEKMVTPQLFDVAAFDQPADTDPAEAEPS